MSFNMKDIALISRGRVWLDCGTVPLDMFNNVVHNDVVKEWLPEELRVFRLRLGVTQERMAELLGVHKNYVSMLENGAKRPSKTLRLLLDCLEWQSGKEARS